MTYFVLFLSLLMVAGSIAVLFQKTLRSAALIMGAVSLLAAAFFVIMKAYDVAITEASIGAVLSTALYFLTLRRLESLRERRGGEEADEE
jgi:energy-converting hydrogenase B subunit D